MNTIEFDLSQDNEAERLAEFCKGLFFIGQGFTSTRAGSIVKVTLHHGK